MSDTSRDIATELLDAALMHVPFDGWSDAAFQAAIADVGVAPALAKGLNPRGAIDLAAAFHRRGDDAMVAALNAQDMSGMRFRDKVALAVRLRLEAADDKEAVRRGVTLFALPMHAAEGAKLIWGTADRIWNTLGDTSRDINWYTKRATLSGVYSSTVLYWLGDDSLGHQATLAFLDRRIDDVMQIEKVKAQVRKAPGFDRLVKSAESVLSRVKPPKARRDDLPGGWTTPR
ncbi:COQ9 family protein [Marivita geojedonensis]|uniref:COQ9 family ubiquinone biosynthesis protein n=1 Tax=Marivita geojedonensis TaxID=1123756 RepID=A0A1X4NMF0_9RHOB|nr:COQ9 family protein [Marivita geojedonensis]OSQ51450.1 COQ9 family ubiquinone biosynthesis protein [Marivita geojedonensis]PRY77875.1 ubiquinone biosynthesis protein COQ9 [Marivita geojedonensis]